MIRRSIGRILLWFTSAARPAPLNFMSREECQALETAAPDKTSCAGTPFLHDSGPISVPLPPPSLAALIDAYAAPTLASDKRGDYAATRLVAARARVSAEIHQERQQANVAFGRAFAEALINATCPAQPCDPTMESIVMSGSQFQAYGQSQ